MIAQVFQEVFDTSYDITFRDRLPRLAGCQVSGWLDPVNDRILIRRGLSLEERSITLLHELVHQCYPDWSEEDVESCAVYIYDRLAEEDKAILGFLATDPAETAIAA